VSTSTVDITYSVTVEDGLGCFKTTSTYSIHVDPRATVDVPTAFTPNGDGTNDFIFPDGWGIKKVNYFRVFNRWGQLLFETNQIKAGWDGTYNGVPQNMETYIYQVSVDTYVDKEALLKTGTFKLIR
jgi:gliding motility-associated-like protein